MDAHSISYTSPSRRSSSRVYQDLSACMASTKFYTNNSIKRLIMDSSTKKRPQSPSKAPEIGIIGAGIAGLRCADVLLQNGFNVTILEARDRIGGRMHQVTLPCGKLVDIGPNWVHGTDHNPILDLANETSTPTHTWDGKLNIYDEDGKVVPDGKVLSDTMWGIIVQAFKYSGNNTATIDPNLSLRDYFEEKVKEALPGKEDHERERKMVMQMSELWGAFVGGPATRQSLKFLWLEECIDGENLFCAGTYQKILAAIAKQALAHANIRLLTKVNRTETSTQGIRVFTDDKQEFTFDEVVVTSPLGWLKKNKQVFQPPLPKRFSQAIDSIGYGCLEKVYITFPQAFWLVDGVDPVNQPFTGFTQWLSPKYASETNPRRWNQEVVDLSTLPGSCAHPTILFYIFGDQSIALAAELAALPTQEKRHEHIARFFKPYYSLLPNYIDTSKDCVPASCLATSWVTDELAGFGSYSTFQTGLLEGDKDIEIMREGLVDRSLWFAGEHTSPFVALGTTTGAYWSGEAVGLRIAKAYGMDAGNSDGVPGVQDIMSNDGTKEVNIRGFADKALDK